MSIVVVGACMIDLVGYAPRLPEKGETIHGSEFATNFGGKGANQCVAAAKLGAETILVARVGDDQWSDKYITNLTNLSVSTKFVQKTTNCNTGMAQIIVAESGDNQIVIIAGANNQLTVNDVSLAALEIQTAAVVVLQLETSSEVAIRALEIAKNITILNGAPALEEFDQRLLTLPTIFCVNETEAGIFTKRTVVSNKDAELAARDLISRGCKNVVITLGSQGALYMGDDQKFFYVECPTVKCLDSTGAGDAFIGAFAFLLATMPAIGMKEILTKSCVIASDSVTRRGTQISFPGKEILRNLL